jgi:hypothetical protein
MLKIFINKKVLSMGGTTIDDNYNITIFMKDALNLKI